MNKEDDFKPPYGHVECKKCGTIEPGTPPCRLCEFRNNEGLGPCDYHAKNGPDVHECSACNYFKQFPNDELPHAVPTRKTYKSHAEHWEEYGDDADSDGTCFCCGFDTSERECPNCHFVH